MDNSTFMDRLMRDIEEKNRPFGGKLGPMGQVKSEGPAAYTGRLVDIVRGSAYGRKLADRDQAEEKARPESLLDIVTKGVGR